MADLTKQQSIKLLTLNKFRISAATTARSRNLTSRSVNVSAPSQNNKSQPKTLPKYPESQNFKRALLKIGALQKQDMRMTFVPDEQDHLTFRDRRMKSLRMKYFKQRCEQDSSEPYNNEEIDEAALGCWNYGEKSSHKGVWRRYKDNLNGLNFDTLKMLGKKRVY